MRESSLRMSPSQVTSSEKWWLTLLMRQTAQENQRVITLQAAQDAMNKSSSTRLSACYFLKQKLLRLYSSDFEHWLHLWQISCLQVTSAPEKILAFCGAEGLEKLTPGEDSRFSKDYNAELHEWQSFWQENHVPEAKHVADFKTRLGNLFGVGAGTPYPPPSLGTTLSLAHVSFDNTMWLA